MGRVRIPVNLANGLTIFRILLIPVFMVFLLGLDLMPSDVSAAMAVAVFTIADLTATLEGYLARSRNAVTVLRQFLAQLTDTLLIAAARLSLVSVGRNPASLPPVTHAPRFAVFVRALVGR